MMLIRLKFPSAVYPKSTYILSTINSMFRLDPFHFIITLPVSFCLPIHRHYTIIISMGQQCSRIRLAQRTDLYVEHWPLSPLLKVHYTAGFCLIHSIQGSGKKCDVRNGATAVHELQQRGGWIPDSQKQTASDIPDITNEFDQQKMKCKSPGYKQPCPRPKTF